MGFSISNDTKDIIEQNTPKYFITKSHETLFKTAWNMFLDKPLLGHGPKLFRVKCKDPKYFVDNLSCDIHPHNFFLQLLSETGLIGFLFLAGLFIYIIFLSIIHMFKYLIGKKIFLSDYQISLLSGLLITTWPITSNGNFFTNHLMLLYALQIGFFRNDL
jgi:O-antigen ligase